MNVIQKTCIFDAINVNRAIMSHWMVAPKDARGQYSKRSERQIGLGSGFSDSCVEYLYPAQLLGGAPWTRQK